MFETFVLLIYAEMCCKKGLFHSFSYRMKRSIGSLYVPSLLELHKVTIR